MGRRERPEDRFRKRLREERERRGWSQSDMAKMLTDNGIPAHATTIAKIEAANGRQVKIDEAAGIADLFGVSLDSLLGRKTALDNDLAHALRSLQEVAHKALWDINMSAHAVRERVVDVFEFEFESSEELERECGRVFEAIDAAQEALANVAGFELPPGAVRLRDELIKRAAYEELGKLLQSADEKGHQG